MEEHLTDDLASEQAVDHKPSIDLLRRVFIPIEKQMPDGNMVLRTMDREVYVRLQNGAIMRAKPKLRGKAARRAERHARRMK